MQCPLFCAIMCKYFHTTSIPMKTCSRCKSVLDISHFSKRSNRPSGVQSKCKTCEREVRRQYYKPHEAIRRKLKISEQQYEELSSKENCESCKRPLTKKCIDHDHATGKVRGVLCNNCNTALGLLYDDPEKIKALGDYLTRHSG